MKNQTESSQPYLVSVCIPSYNEPTLFKRCLDSILSQDYSHIEIVISDDSSTNDVKTIAAEVSAQIPIKYMSNNPALKSPRNWNNALDMASGDLVLLMHHDDFFTFDSSVRSFVELFEKDSSVDIVFSTPMACDDERKCITYGYSSSSFLQMMKQSHRLFVTNILGAPSNVMLKNNSIRYREDLVWMVDMEYYYRNIQAGLKSTYTSEPLVTTGIHQNQTTAFCNAHPDIALREHILVGASLSEDVFKDIVLFDHFWRQLRNNRIRSIHDSMLNGLTLPAPMRHMLRFLVVLPVRLTFIGILSKSMMMLSYLMWRLRSK